MTKKFLATLIIQTLIIQSLIVVSTKQVVASDEKYPCPSIKYAANTSGFAKFSNYLYSENLKRLDSKYGSSYYPRCLSGVTQTVADGSEGMNIAELLMSPEGLGKHILEIESATAKASGKDFDASKYNPETLGRQYMMEYNGTGYTNEPSAIDWNLKYPEMKIGTPERYAEFIKVKNENLKKDGKIATDKTNYSGSSNTSSTQSTPNTNSPTASNSQTANINSSDLTSGSIENKAMMSTLTMATIGLLTSRLYTCKMTADMYAAAAAGTAFIAGEIINFKDIKKSLKEIDAQIKNESKEDYQTQIQAFYKLKEGYQEIIKTSKNKTTLQKAAAAAFAGAAIAAGVMYAKNKTMIADCTTSLAATSKACTAAFSASCSTGCVAPLQTAATLNATAVGQNTVADAKDEAPQFSAQAEAASLASMLAMSSQNASAASMCPASAASKMKCDAAYTFKKNNAGVCPAVLSIASFDSVDSNMIKLKDFSIPYPVYWNGLNALLFPKAKASSTALLGLGAAAAAFVAGTSKALGPKIDTMIYNPKNRAILWGVLAGLTYAATNDTEQVIEQLKRRVSMIDDIIKSMENQSGKNIENGNSVANENKNSNGSSNGQNNSSTESRVKTEAEKSRVNGNNPDISLSNKLPCYTKMINGSCQSIMDAMKSSPSFSQLDLKTQKQFEKTAKALGPLNGASSLTRGSLSDLESLGAGTVQAMNNLNKDLVEKYKIPQKDVNQIEEKKKELLDAVQNQLKKSNSTPNAMYASFGGIGGLTPNLGSNSLKAGSETPDSKYGASSLNGGHFGSGLTGLKGKDPKTFEEVSSKNDEVQVTSGSKSGASSAGEEESDQIADVDLNDISKDKEKSIFSIISERYQKTGYSRLSEKSKEKKDIKQ